MHWLSLVDHNSEVILKVSIFCRHAFVRKNEILFGTFKWILVSFKSQITKVLYIIFSQLTRFQKEWLWCLKQNEKINAQKTTYGKSSQYVFSSSGRHSLGSNSGSTCSARRPRSICRPSRRSDRLFRKPEKVDLRF